MRMKVRKRRGEERREGKEMIKKKKELSHKELGFVRDSRKTKRSIHYFLSL